MLIKFNEENWPIPQKISLVGEELVFLVFLWNGRLFLLKALGGAAPKQQCPLSTVERLRRKPVFGFENEARLCILAIWAQGA